MASRRNSKLRNPLSPLSASSVELPYTYSPVSTHPLAGDVEEEIPISPTWGAYSEFDFEAADAVNPGETGADAVNTNFRFVTANWFLAFSALVVVVNTTMVFLEMANSRLKESWWMIDDVFLVFYFCEFSLRALYFQKYLLCAASSEVLWNWLDLILTLAGALDEYIRVTSPEGEHTDGLLVITLRSLRILRVLRVLRLVRVFMMADTSWADGARFQSFMGGAIILNAGLMGLETDIPWSGWYWAEQGFLVIFLFEILVNVKRNGCGFFSIYHGAFLWNYLDLVIVAGAALEMWLLPLISVMDPEAGRTAEHLTFLMTSLRMMRLLRILRLVKLVKVVKPLYTLALGVMEAMQGMFWVLVLTCVMLYAFAILATRLIGHGLVFKTMGKSIEDAGVVAVMGLFPTIFQSMFLLFTVVNGNEMALEPLFAMAPYTKMFYAIFVVLSSWALLSILTAVVSDNMIQATQTAEAEYQEDLKRGARKQLIQLFSELDSDGNGTLSKDEFDSLVCTEGPMNDTIKKMSHLGNTDLSTIFEYLETDGEVHLDDFVDGLLYEAKPVSERSVMRLEKKMRSVEGAQRQQIEKVQDAVDAIASKIESSVLKLTETSVERFSDAAIAQLLDQLKQLLQHHQPPQPPEEHHRIRHQSLQQPRPSSESSQLQPQRLQRLQQPARLQHVRSEQHRAQPQQLQQPAQQHPRYLPPHRQGLQQHPAQPQLAGKLPPLPMQPTTLRDRGGTLDVRTRWARKAAPSGHGIGYSSNLSSDICNEAEDAPSTDEAFSSSTSLVTQDDDLALRRRLAAESEDLKPLSLAERRDLSDAEEAGSIADGVTLMGSISGGNGQGENFEREPHKGPLFQSKVQPPSIMTISTAAASNTLSARSSESGSEREVASCKRRQNESSVRNEPVLASLQHVIVRMDGDLEELKQQLRDVVELQRTVLRHSADGSEAEEMLPTKVVEVEASLGAYPGRVVATDHLEGAFAAPELPRDTDVLFRSSPGAKYLPSMEAEIRRVMHVVQEEQTKMVASMVADTQSVLLEFMAKAHSHPQASSAENLPLAEVGHSGERS